MSKDTKVRPTQTQMRYLVDLMANDQQLCSGKFTKSFTHKITQQRWESISIQLNALPGAEKSWNKWKKTWQDNRNITKSKAAAIKRHIGGTGGGSKCEIELNEVQKEILPLFSQASVSGHFNSEESVVEFDFDDITKDVLTDANELCIEELVETITYSNSEKENNEPPLNIKAVNENYYEPSTFEPLTTTTSAHKPNSKRKLTAGAKLDESNSIAERLAKISEEKCRVKAVYYDKKLKLMEENNKILKNIETVVSTFIHEKSKIL
ncbi:uncharacterized protein LOC100573445 [Acyrthosiphon pisum]|uniref:Regulatory protein zeste n=1 Tax=Acyrthosiphon pisum TaxID=7029 RepID=A0A8R2A8A2_ACYPI|nr:uncharacterized protein LOC100573445 [Acyrthosiphon pisum]|eukprot:XP_003243647.1 PREDICTED: uncharacterized protein LOC100573445 [Acyrthosiphon pisum]